jgi:hypothetical protein
MVRIGDEVMVDFEVDGVLKAYRGNVVGKGKKKRTWMIDFEDGESLDVPYQDVKPVEDNNNQAGTGFWIVPKVETI